MDNMLEVINLKKSFQIGKEENVILKNLNFCEFFTFLDILHIIKALETIVDSKGFLCIFYKKMQLIIICKNMHKYISLYLYFINPVAADINIPNFIFANITSTVNLSLPAVCKF